MRPTFPTHPARSMVLALLLASLTAVRATAQTHSPQEELWDAAIRGDTAAMATALQRGAAIDSLDTRRSLNGRRALNWAAWYNQPAAIRFLVARGARVNSTNHTGFTPLHHAAENGALDAARTLVSLGADRTVLNQFGQRPADVAGERGQTDVAALLDSLPPE